jgi:hypothetical protein
VEHVAFRLNLLATITITTTAAIAATCFNSHQINAIDSVVVQCALTQPTVESTRHAIDSASGASQPGRCNRD